MAVRDLADDEVRRMSGRSTTVIAYEPPMEELEGSPAAESEELAKLQEKVISTDQVCSSYVI